MPRFTPAALALLLSAMLAQANDTPMPTPTPAPAIPRLTPPELAISLTETVYLPAQVSLLEHHGRLAGRLAALCEAPGSDKLAAAREAWISANRSWRRLDSVRMGPGRQEEVMQAFDPWPLDLAALRKSIAATPADPTSPQALAEVRNQKQGLPAIEFLLFGNATPTSAALAAKQLDGNSCRFAVWIAAGLARRAQEMVYEWQGMRRGLNYDLSYPRPFLSESLTRVHAGVKELAGWKLATSVAKAAQQDFPDWRSGQSRQGIISGLDTVEHVLLGAAGGAGFEEFLLSRGKTEAVGELKTHLAQARIAVAGLPDDLAKASAERRVAAQRLTALADYIAGPFAEAMGLPLQK
ncbi:imelysin family protein [Chitinolyticbacter albus]|uniref:imelysin family protein n=1 Tax=Chitinolyticbacter albus TaxID=2961951 RepID=UPI00210B9DB8|nr:imelysin family protein [Chitinolyticbacter albus]